MNIVKINIADRHELLRCYIKQFKFGGIFAKGRYNYTLGEEVFLLMTLVETEESFALNSTVGWVTPPTTAGYPEGIGCQFNNDKASIAARNRIELLLGSALNRDHDCYTF